MEDNKINLSETFEKLDNVIKAMESSDISLEDSFAKFKEGLELIKQANDSIEKVEQELTVLEENL